MEDLILSIFSVLLMVTTIAYTNPVVPSSQACNATAYLVSMIEASEHTQPCGTPMGGFVTLQGLPEINWREDLRRSASNAATLASQLDQILQQISDEGHLASEYIEQARTNVDQQAFATLQALVEFERDLPQQQQEEGRLLVDLYMGAYVVNHHLSIMTTHYNSHMCERDSLGITAYLQPVIEGNGDLLCNLHSALYAVHDNTDTWNERDGILGNLTSSAIQRDLQALYSRFDTQIISQRFQHVMGLMYSINILNAIRQRLEGL